MVIFSWQNSNNTSHQSNNNNFCYTDSNFNGEPVCNNNIARQVYTLKVSNRGYLQMSSSVFFWSNMLTFTWYISLPKTLFKPTWDFISLLIKRFQCINWSGTCRIQHWFKVNISSIMGYFKFLQLCMFQVFFPIIQCAVYHIVPSASSPCPPDLTVCLTIEYLINTTNNHSTETNVTLFFFARWACSTFRVESNQLKWVSHVCCWY